MAMTYADFLLAYQPTLNEWLPVVLATAPTNQNVIDAQVFVDGGTPQPTTPTFSLALPLGAPTSVEEGNPVNWTLSLTNAVAGQAYSVTLANVFGGPVGGTPATAADVGPLTVTGTGVTFTPATGLVTFAAGATTATVTQTLLTDTVTPEPGETVTLDLSAPTNGAVEGGTAPTPITIIDVPEGVPVPVSVDGQGTIDVPATLDATTGAFNYTDAAGTQNNVVINGFGADDRITVSGATAADYDAAIGTNAAGDVTLAFNNNGTLNSIVLVGVAAGTAVFDVASFNALPNVGDLFFA